MMHLILSVTPKERNKIKYEKQRGNYEIDGEIFGIGYTTIPALEVPFNTYQPNCNIRMSWKQNLLVKKFVSLMLTKFVIFFISICYLARVNS